MAFITHQLLKHIGHHAGVRRSAVAGRGRQLWGGLLLLGNTSTGAVYVLLQKQFLRHGDRARRHHLWSARPVTLTAWIYCCSALSILIFVPLALCANLLESDFWQLDGDAAIPCGYAIGMSALSYSLISYANRYLQPSAITAFFVVQVLVATSLAYLMFHNELNNHELFGGLLIVLGLCFTVYANTGSAEPKSRNHDGYVNVPVCERADELEMENEIGWEVEQLRQHLGNELEALRDPNPVATVEEAYPHRALLKEVNALDDNGFRRHREVAVQKNVQHWEGYRIISSGK